MILRGADDGPTLNLDAWRENAPEHEGPQRADLLVSRMRILGKPDRLSPATGCVADRNAIAYHIWPGTLSTTDGNYG